MKDMEEFTSRESIDTYVNDMLWEHTSKRISLSEGQIARIVQEQNQRSRLQRIVQVRELERDKAKSRRQEYQRRLSGKRQNKMEQKFIEFEQRKETDIRNVHETYRSALSSIGVAHNSAQVVAYHNSALDAQKQAEASRNVMKEHMRHQMALDKSRNDRMGLGFNVRKENGRRSQEMRMKASHMQRERARRAAAKREHQLQLQAIQEEELEEKPTTDTVYHQVLESGLDLKDVSVKKIPVQYTSHLDSEYEDGFTAAIEARKETARRSQAMQEMEIERQGLARKRGHIALEKEFMDAQRQVVENDLAAIDAAQRMKTGATIAMEVAKQAAAKKVQKKRLESHFEKVFITPQFHSENFLGIIEQSDDVQPAPNSDRISIPGETRPETIATEIAARPSSIAADDSSPAEVKKVIDKKYTASSGTQTVEPEVKATQTKIRAVSRNNTNEETDSYSEDEETRILLEESKNTRIQAKARLEKFMSGSLDNSYSTDGSTDLSVFAKAAIAASAASTAAVGAARIAASNYMSYPSRDQLERSISQFLEDDDAELESSHSFRDAWTPRRNPDEPAQPLSEFARSLVRDLNKESVSAERLIDARYAGHSLISEDIDSDKEDLNINTRRGSLGSMTLKHMPLTPGSSIWGSSDNEDQLVVEDDGWKDSDVFVSWMQHVETVLSEEANAHQSDDVRKENVVKNSSIEDASVLILENSGQVAKEDDDSLDLSKCNSGGSHASLDSLSQVQRALQKAREELRATTRYKSDQSSSATSSTEVFDKLSKNESSIFGSSFEDASHFSTVYREKETDPHGASSTVKHRATDSISNTDNSFKVTNDDSSFEIQQKKEKNSKEESDIKGDLDDSMHFPDYLKPSMTPQITRRNRMVRDDAFTNPDELIEPSARHRGVASSVYRDEETDSQGESSTAKHRATDSISNPDDSFKVKNDDSSFEIQQKKEKNSKEESDIKGDLDDSMHFPDYLKPSMTPQITQRNRMVRDDAFTNSDELIEPSARHRGVASFGGHNSNESANISEYLKSSMTPQITERKKVNHEDTRDLNESIEFPQKNQHSSMVEIAEREKVSHEVIRDLDESMDLPDYLKSSMTPQITERKKVSHEDTERNLNETFDWPEYMQPSVQIGERENVSHEDTRDLDESTDLPDYLKPSMTPQVAQQEQSTHDELNDSLDDMKPFSPPSGGVSTKQGASTSAVALDAEPDSVSSHTVPTAFQLRFDSDDEVVHVPIAFHPREPHHPPSPVPSTVEKLETAGGVAFQVNNEPNQRSAEEISRRFAERSQQRAMEAKTKALEFDKRRVYKEKKILKPQAVAPVLSRLSSGARADVSPEERRIRTTRMYKNLPEVVEKNKEREKEKQAMERRRKVQEMEEERRRNLTSRKS